MEHIAEPGGIPDPELARGRVLIIRVAGGNIKIPDRSHFQGAVRILIQEDAGVSARIERFHDFVAEIPIHKGIHIDQIIVALPASVRRMNSSRYSVRYSFCLR